MWWRLEGAALVLGGLAVLLSGCSCQGPAARDLVTGKGVPVVRVKLGDDAPSLAVSVAGPWRLAHDGRQEASGQALAWTDLAEADGQIVLGGRPLGPGPVELSGDVDGSVRVRPSAGGREHAYRGTVRVSRVAGGGLRAVNVLNLEAYLAGVVCREMFSSWDLEALKAQAVAARTFALRARNAGTRRDFDVYDSVMSQVYGGLGSETAKSRQAVLATWGIVGTYGGKGGRQALLPMYYHSACGGATADAGDVFGGTTLPPLKGVLCRYCYRSPRYQWSDVVLTKQEISEAMRRSSDAAVRTLAPLARIEVAAQSAAGRTTHVRLIDERGAEAVLRSNGFRGLVGASKLPSSWFVTEDRGDAVAFSGRGFGHGVGMCQYGAQYLAEHGKTAEEILRYYYPGVKLARAY
jgi:stage II sporulation protein D